MELELLARELEDHPIVRPVQIGLFHLSLVVARAAAALALALGLEALEHSGRLGGARECLLLSTLALALAAAHCT
eukprot:2824042-Heterocapsa_arctica.AAC.1